ncbi:Ger(x)C family spore germination protein [Virgibacillus salexigens]|uniref:Ger(x)C family spore germination protein n=1 Tax=Virgibacillus salexigens TaxID=61016 RepID=UPI00190BF254|nr:Ger(x)C family spore germination protein [Virgibacillus salexigens]
MRKSKQSKLLIVLLSITFLSGCWDIKDIDKRSLPLVMGISGGGSQGFQVSLQIPISQKSSQESRVVSGKGANLTSVLEQFRMNSEDAIDYSQIRLIIIHSEFANNRNQMEKLIKFLMGFKEIPSNVLLAITNDSVEKVLSNINNKLGVNATAIYGYFNKGDAWAPEIFSTAIWEVYQSLLSYTKDIPIPLVRSGEDTVLSFEGYTILTKGKASEVIGPNEGHLINLFHNNAAKRKLDSLDFSSMIITNSSLQNKISLKNNIPKVSSNLILDIEVLEKDEGVTNNRIKDEYERLIEEKFYQLLEKSQAKNIDIFGFGQQFRSLIPYHELRNWKNDYYPKLKVDFRVHVNSDEEPLIK